MNDQAALLAAIIANPAEDTPRLMYADWLEENNQENRAEFIRLQVGLSIAGTAFAKVGTQSCQSANCGRGNWCNVCATVNHWNAFRPGALKREAELWPAVQTELNRETRLGCAREWLPATDEACGLVRRGFVEECRMSTAEWFRATIRQTHPVTVVRFTTPLVLQWVKQSQLASTGRVVTEWKWQDAPKSRVSDKLPAFRKDTHGTNIIDIDNLLADEFPGVKFQFSDYLIWYPAANAIPVSVDWVSREVTNFDVLNFGLAEAPGNPSYANALVDQAAFNAVMGTVLEKAIIEDGLLPAGDDEEPEDGDSGD